VFKIPADWHPCFENENKVFKAQTGHLTMPKTQAKSRPEKSPL